MLKEIVLLFLTLFGTTNCNYCTDKCQFSLSFDEPFHLPDHCPQEYGHNYIQCHADLQIDYIEKTVDVNLYADENIPTGGSLYQMDLFSSFDQPDEQMTASLQYSCVYVDDCARNFTEERYKMLLDHQKILYAMKNNLYNVGSSNVQQCYDLDNKTIDCKNGLCRTELGSYVQSDDPYTIIPYYKTYCDYYPPDDPFHNRTGFMSTTTQAISIGVNGNYCTDQCQFSLSFNDQYQVPENCPKAYGHTFLLCHSDLQIDYIAKTVDINLYAEENTLTDSEKYRMDLNSSFDQPDEQMTGSLQYSCAVLDDCARDFTAKIYKMLLNHQAIFYTMKNNLYTIVSSTVQQCYDVENKTIDCKNGLCRAELGSYLKPDDPFTPIPYYKTYCDYYPPDDPFHNKTGLMSIYPYGYSTVFGVFNTLHYVCNKNLCNNYESIQSIQTLVEDFNNFDKPSPSPSTATTISSALKLILTLSLIKCFLINSYLK